MSRLLFFGSLTWRPTEDVEVLVGVRRIDEEKDATNAYFDHSDGTFTVPANEFDFSSFPTTAGTAYSADDDWDDTIWTGSAKWDYTQNNRVYVSYSEGFRSGGFSIRSARDPSEAAFDPETAEQWEIGFKNEFLDGALTLNVAWYEIERDGSQFSSIISLPPGSIPGTTTIINNGGKSTTDGWELEGRWLIDDNWTLSFNYGTVEADNEAFTLPCEIVDGCASGVPGVTDPPGTLRELGGNDDSRQPDESYSVTLAYTAEIGNGTLYANVGYKYTGEFLLVNTGAGNDQRTFDGDYDLWDARIAYDMPLSNGAMLTFTASGKNLTDEEYREQALFLGDGTFLLPSGGPNTGFQGWGAPRTYAFEVKYSM